MVVQQRSTATNAHHRSPGRPRTSGGGWAGYDCPALCRQFASRWPKGHAPTERCHNAIHAHVAGSAAGLAVGSSDGMLRVPGCGWCRGVHRAYRSSHRHPMVRRVWGLLRNLPRGLLSIDTSPADAPPQGAWATHGPDATMISGYSRSTMVRQMYVTSTYISARRSD